MEAAAGVEPAIKVLQTFTGLPGPGTVGVSRETFTCSC